MSEPTTERKLYEIAREIKETWVDKDGRYNPYFGAVPYIDALECLTNKTDSFGYDDAKDIVIRFLVNARTWRGEDAKRIKAELKRMFNIK